MAVRMKLKPVVLSGSPASGGSRYVLCNLYLPDDSSIEARCDFYFAILPYEAIRICLKIHDGGF